MTQHWSDHSWNLKLAITLAIANVIVLSGGFTLAQDAPVADDSLGSESSVVTPNIIINNVPSDKIDGGATRGTNLFHSFQEFNILIKQGVYFTNPAGIENILVRVTGSNSSNISGTLGVLGNANLFLINPNGIIFGESSSLDVRGSFVATTANAIRLGDTGIFSAARTEPSNLLTVKPSALFFNALSSKEIVSRANQSNESFNTGQPTVGLQVPDGQSLLLVGGDVRLEDGFLLALGGRIELGGVASQGAVGLTVDNNNLSLNFPDGVARSDVSLEGLVSVVAGNSGSIAINAQNIDVLVGTIIQAGLDTRATSDSQAGDITLDAPGRVNITSSFILNNAEGLGNSGNIRIKAGDLSLTASNGIAQVNANNNGQGDAGAVFVEAKNSVAIDNGSIFSQTNSQGKGGVIEINAETLALTSGANLSASTFGEGDAGNIRLNTRQLSIQDGGNITVTNSGPNTANSGKAGNLVINSDLVELNRGILSAQAGTSEGGNITIKSGSLQLRNGSHISTTAGSLSGGGNGGDITIKADTLIGVENSDITANAFEGMGGFIRINAQSIFGLEVVDTRNIDELRTNNTSDISASSQTDPSLNGEVEINRPEADPSRGLVTLPTELVDVSRLIAQGCSGGGGAVAREPSKFVATGRGGLPPTPTEALRSDSVLADLGTSVEGQGNRPSATSPNSTNSQLTPLVEAQGWEIGTQGEVVLIAQAASVTSRIPWLTPTSCNES